MKRHLTPAQFVDLAEGVQPESSLPHLATCEACRRDLADMRAMMSAADTAGAPEPSPLFWDHLSARVREAVAAVADEDARPRSWRERLLQPLVLVPSLAGAIAVALLAVLVPRAPLTTTLPSTPLSVAGNAVLPTASPSLPPLAPFGATDDPQLSLVAAVATAGEWDEMRDEVALATGGSSDAVAGALTADEQRALRRLLAEEMARPRALESRS